jgi:dipeptidyl aminopeptidase/acylaminoacyl peptidase
MPELREVFDMTTRQVEPDGDALRELEKRQRRSLRNRKIGAFAVVAAIGLAAVVFVVSNRTESSSRPAVAPSPIPVPEISVPSSVDLRTGEATPLPQSILDGWFYFTSPDRTMFVFTAGCCDSPNPVFVANADGTGVRQITPDGIDGFVARWSPDGSMLVYQQRDGNTLDIGNVFVIDVATGQATQVTDLAPASYGIWSLHPSFSADGQTIIFHLARGRDGVATTRWDLWSVPVAGGEPTLVVRDAGEGVYGPDGETLAYLDSMRDGRSSRLMIAGADGSDPRLLVEGDQLGYPRWSPDGTRIVYSDSDGTHVVDVSTGESSLVTRIGIADWFGDDTLIVFP